MTEEQISRTISVKPVTTIQEVDTPTEREGSRYIPFKIPKSQEEMLDAGKVLGLTKNSMVTKGITLVHWLNNRAGWDNTKEATFPHILLKNLREHARQNGASVEILAEMDVQIKHWEETLKKLEKDGKIKVVIPP